MGVDKHHPIRRRATSDCPNQVATNCHLSSWQVLAVPSMLDTRLGRRSHAMQSDLESAGVHHGKESTNQHARKSRVQLSSVGVIRYQLQGECRAENASKSAVPLIFRVIVSVADRWRSSTLGQEGSRRSTAVSLKQQSTSKTSQYS